MSKIGTFILCLFATAWSWLAIIRLGASPAWVLPPAALALALCLQARAIGSRLPPRLAEANKRLGRSVGLWSGLEAVALIVTVNLLQACGRADLSIPAAVAIVGLHFLPLARAIPFPAYYPIGAAMILVAGASLGAPTPVARDAAASGGAAIVLFAAALAVNRHLAERARQLARA